jgi:hypothetical protein
VIEHDAYPQITLVDGNPLEDLKLLGVSYSMWDSPRADITAKTMSIIMKGGMIYRHQL